MFASIMEGLIADKKSREDLGERGSMTSRNRPSFNNMDCQRGRYSLEKNWDPLKITFERSRK